MKINILKKIILLNLILTIIFLASCGNTENTNKMTTDTVTPKLLSMPIEILHPSNTPGNELADIAIITWLSNWVMKIKVGYERENIVILDNDGNPSEKSGTLTYIEVVEIYSNEYIKKVKVGDRIKILEQYCEYDGKLWFYTEGLPLIPGEEYILSVVSFDENTPYNKKYNNASYYVRINGVYSIHDYREIPAYERIITGEGLTHPWGKSFLPISYEWLYLQVMQQYGNK